MLRTWARDEVRKLRKERKGPGLDNELVKTFAPPAHGNQDRLIISNPIFWVLRGAKSYAALLLAPLVMIQGGESRTHSSISDRRGILVLEGGGEK